MTWSIYLGVVVQGVLTGLVYGLMALGLSVIFGVVRVVNFAHGEFAVVAMYVDVPAVSHARPRSADHPAADRGGLLRRRLCAAGDADQPFVGRSEHEQFILLVGVAIIILNGLLMLFGPDARPANLPYAFDSYEVGPLFIDKARIYSAVAALAIAAALFAFFRYTATGTAIRACADNLTGAAVVGLNVKRLYAITFGIGLACVGAAGALMVTIADAAPSLGAGLYAACVHHRHRRRARLDGGRSGRRRADRRVGGTRRAFSSRPR